MASGLLAGGGILDIFNNEVLTAYENPTKSKENG